MDPVARRDERGVTSDHDDASNQNPGTKMMSMAVILARATDKRLGGAVDR